MQAMAEAGFGLAEPASAESAESGHWIGCSGQITQKKQ